MIADIKENNGIYHNSHLHLGHNLLFSDVKYYDGKIILNAYRNGQTSTLNKRQFETLSSALALVKGVTGTELERELAIHDALCARITYQADDDPHNDDDCVIGALLYGKANCDGYADAFYLCGGLAGLDIRYQHGTAVDRSKDSETFIEKDETHLWNLIRIGERWAMIDVTWDDDEYGYAHTYYNIGMEQAKATHIWDERAMRYALTETTDNDLRNPELKQSQVSSFDGNGLGVVLLGYVQNRSERICLSSKSLSFITHEDELSILLYSDGITDFKWKLTPVAAEIYDIKYVEEFKCIIDKNDIFPYIEYLANSNIRSFSLYIHPYNPALREYLFSNNCAMLCYALARTRLVNPEGFRYNEKYGRVVFTNAEFYPSTVEWKTLAPPTVYRMQQDIWEFAAERGQYLIIDFSRTLGLNSNHDLIETALYSAGIDHFSGGFYGPSLRITNIQYPKHFTQVYSTTYPLGEIKSYIESCSKLGIHHFIVCFPREEYRKAFGNVQSELTRLFAEAGVANPSNARWWSAYCKVVFDNAEFYPASVKWEYKKVFSMDYVQWAVEDFVNERGDILILDYSSGPDLYENYKQLSSILYSSGIKTFDCEFYCGMVRIKNVQYK